MESPTLVLVHSPLVGPLSWAPTAEDLRVRGRRVVVPSLGTAITSARPRFEAMADVVRDAGAGEPVILVVHSRAGTLVPSVVERMPDLVDGVVFVDAMLPHPGRAWFDRAPPETAEHLRRLGGTDGVLPPWHEWFPSDVLHDLVPEASTRASLIAEIPRVPLDHFAEVAPVDDAWTARPCGYLQLSDAYDDAAAEARSRRWKVMRHEGHHLSTVTEPRVVADKLLELADVL